MAKPSLSSIYNRLNNVDPYHPYETQTFSDWSVEAGDVVSVSRGNAKYNSPLSSTTLEWNGAPKVTMVSSGQQKRDSVTRAAEKKYSRGGGGYRNSKDVNTSITQTQTMIELEAHDRSQKDAELSASIKVSAGQIESLVQRTGVGKLGKGQTLYSRITQTESSISSVVSKTGINKLGKNETLYSQIQQNANAIKLKVSAGKVATQLAVECGNVSITGGNLIVDGFIKANNVRAAAAEIGWADITGIDCDVRMTHDVEIEGTLDVSVIQTHDIVSSIGYFVGTNSNAATWQSKTVVTELKRSASRQFVYAVNGSTSNLSTITGSIITSATTETIYYLGHT